MISCKEFACTSYACLHLVSNNEDIFFCAEVVYRIYKLLIEGIYAALALYVLKHYRTHCLIFELCFEV